MDSLLQLAERCEAAEGPDREIDLHIEVLVNPEYEGLNEDRVGFLVRYGLVRYGGHRHFTASLDAAMMLVPKGWSFTVATWWCEGDEAPPFFADCGDIEALKRDDPNAVLVEARASTPALALCAAALRARHSQGVSDNG